MITKQELASHLKHRRPDVTSDEDWGQLTVIREYKDLPIEGKRVMDIGGNIGAMAIRCALEGCEMVMTYEPEQDNYRVLLDNTAPFDAIVANRFAVTNDPSGTRKNLWLTGTGTMGSCSTTEFRGRIPQEITTVNFMEELSMWEFTSIKMDCEGEEWELLSNPIPDFVTDIVAELHFTKRYWREELFLPTLARMAQQGFYFVREPKNTGKNFHTLAHWRRG